MENAEREPAAGEPKLVTDAAGDGVALTTADHPAGPSVDASAEPNASSIEPVELDTAQDGRAPWPFDAPRPMLTMPALYRAANAGEMPDGNEIHAAIITKVNDDCTVSLSVFPEGRNPMFVSNVRFSDCWHGEELSPGQWTYPRYGL